MTVTMDRYDLTAKCLGPALAKAGCEFELLSCDNGSTDRRVVEYVANLNPAYHRWNQTNEGYAPMLNQMILRGKGEYFCILDPDIEPPESGWLARLVEANRAIPESGISGYHCVEALGTEMTVNGIKLFKHFHCFGIKFFNRALTEKLGGYCEDYSPYGLEDNEMNHRINAIGLMNYYLPGEAIHHGSDGGDDSPYRKMKWDSLKRGGPICDANLAKYAREKNYYVPFPELR